MAYIIYYTWGVSLSLSIRAGHAPYFLLCLSLRQCFPFPARRMACQRGRFRHHFFAHRFKKRTIIVESSIKLRKIHSKVRIDGLGKNPLKFWLYIWQPQTKPLICFCFKENLYWTFTRFLIAYLVNSMKLISYAVDYF